MWSYLCSHINQKTQFENPVMEAKKKSTPAAQTPAAVPTGKSPPGPTADIHYLSKKKKNG